MRASLLLGLLAFAAPQDAAHAKGAGKVLLSELPRERRDRVWGLWNRLVCACPDENWSKLLANCPDGCADPQKQQVIQGVTAGQGDDAILADQEARYGPKVRAEGAGIWLFLVPFLGGVMLVAFGLMRLRRPAAVAAPATAGSGSVAAAELTTVERELKEIE